jgi:single-stranded DNA-binding protein
MADAVKKGDLIDVTGRVKTETWKTQDGEERRQLTVTAEQWSVVGRPAPATPAPAPAAPSGDDIDEDDVPF